jgi:poly-gamma-glutamate synthesis protein (capsule biosynthesis protein)
MKRLLRQLVGDPRTELTPLLARLSLLALGCNPASGETLAQVSASPDRSASIEPAPPPAPEAQPAAPSSASPAQSAAAGAAGVVGRAGTRHAGDGIVTLSAVGDCTLGDPAGSERAPGSFHDVLAKHGGDLAYPFSGVRALLEDDDLTIANLEGTLTTRAPRTDIPFAFRGRPEFAGMLPLGSVELVALANNHMNDCGPRGTDDTIAALDAAKVAYFGLGHVDERTIDGVEVVNLGWTGGRDEILGEVQRSIREHKRDDNLVIASFHWGIENEHAVNSVQLKLGRGAIDAGADLVLGHHPHVLQGIETYRGRTIVYSLGNFVFGGNARPSELDTVIFRARFAKKDGKVVELDHAIVPVSVSGNRAQNDFRPVPLEGADAEHVRANVARYSASLPR